MPDMPLLYMTDKEIAYLEEKAKKASKGPWHFDDDEMFIYHLPDPNDDSYKEIIVEDKSTLSNPDGYYITVANPHTILRLIAKLRWVEERLEFASNQRHNMNKPSPNGKIAGQWDYHGSIRGSYRHRPETFSVRVFQWREKKSGGLKPGRMVKRFSGRIDKPEEVFAKARAYIVELERQGPP